MKELESWMDSISEEEVDRLVDSIFSARRIVCFGAGRMGISLRAFSMRLNHLGKESYFYDNSMFIPPVGKGDMFLFASGSGNTGTVLGLAKSASRTGCTIASIVGNGDSPLAVMSDVIVRFRPCSGGMNYGESERNIPSIQIMSTLNEQGLYMLCDMIALKYCDRYNMDRRIIEGRHCNVE